VNSTPQLQITAPSFISGPDYASTIVGNPWDMSDPGDLSSTPNITGGTFTNGIFRGTNVGGNDDPAMNLRVTTPIDTSRFKYATYRMQVDTMDDPFRAPVARWLWWDTRPETASPTDDIVVYEGFRTVSYDLSTIIVDKDVPNAPKWTSLRPNFFRLDPHEYGDPMSFQLDYAMLTANDRANQSFNIRYNASDADGGNQNIQFFFDADAQGYNGAPITCSTVTPVPAPGNFKVYMPLQTFGAPPPVQPTGASCTWNTASVPNGTYYVYGVINDGTDTLRVYSQTPVEIIH
jgi:hypothetical protein